MVKYMLTAHSQDVFRNLFFKTELDFVCVSLFIAT